MAALACLVAGEHHRFRSNVGNGCGAVVPVLSETTGDKETTRHQEDDDACQEDRRHSE
jgi:hypothetical protein